MNYLFLAQRIYIKKKSLEKYLGLKHFCKFTSCKSFFGFATFVITEKSNEGFGRAFGPLEWSRGRVGTGRTLVVQPLKNDNFLVE